MLDPKGVRARAFSQEEVRAFPWQRTGSRENVYETESIYIPPPKKTPTPYGGRLVWRMPGNNLLIAHLKDKVRIRHRKRWSQVMYMYYLLGHRLMEMPIDEKRKEVLAENTYILTLDGDINFRPRAVRLLVDLMKKNRNLGAACGRIHPVGSGPMVWYQKFEYAIGHWLQKATEHMIGCVLCSPGCFSLFRAKALMDDNVMRKYTTKSDEAKHYVQYDQGEDRWLCTLLLQRGYRVEYSAASDAYTHCPEGFGEFYTQRRRWAPSTMANIMDLLMDYKRTVAINDNISVPYIIYQTMLMVGTILGPGTIFLMLVGAMVAAFKISNWYSFYYNIIPILLFMAICFIAKNDIQILVAQIMSAAYALLMMAVLVGTAIQLSYDGIGSPSSIFLIALSGSFFIAALLHPQEFWCVVPGLLYFLSIPSMYLLLIIYSLVNLNVVTWGTREVLNKKEQEQQEEEKKKKKMGKKGKWLNSLMANANVLEDEEGSITVSLANLFKCMFCTYPKPNNEQKVLESINDQMREFSAKLVSIESSLKRKHHHTTHHFSDDEFQNETKTKEPKDRWDVMSSDGTDVRAGLERAKDSLETWSTRDISLVKINCFLFKLFFSSPTCDVVFAVSQGEETKRDDKHAYWLDDKALSQCKVEYLEDNEVSFWNGLIEKYLFPLDQDKEQERRVAVELKELRNKVVFFFFMFNALFILIVFLLQLNKDRLHIDWPLGVKFNITYIPETSEVRIDKEYLELEPIGLVFAVFFALILIIQFVAMLFHRFGTFSHMLAAAEFNFFNAKTTDELNPSVNDIASEVLNIGEQDDERDKNQGGSLDGSYKGVANRNVVGNLINHHRRRQPVRTMDYLFKKRFENLNRNPGGTPILGEASGKRRRNGQGRAKVESLGIKNSLANGGGATTRHRSTTDVRNLFPEDQGPYHLNRGYQQEMDHGGELEPHLPSSRNSLNGSRYGRL
ncbi:chs1 [Cordylochernes scorpioides]|uniref:chitin synthase n=1 Tax=Cordylochernes scorpioides TaxID=51811 RepID=A0ABY6K2R8_9ARAC|nr:chs1 [Cordylochernes scorpioides]